MVEFGGMECWCSYIYYMYETAYARYFISVVTCCGPDITPICQ